MLIKNHEQEDNKEKITTQDEQNELLKTTKRLLPDA